MAEEKKIDLKKNVFSKAQYLKTIDTSFNELGVQSIAEQLQQETSVEEFFQLYNQLFYEIPAEGTTNSHRYLVEQSGEYINFDQQLEEIEALRAEITQLRTDLLNAQIENIKLQATGSVDVNQNLSELQSQISQVQSNSTAYNNQINETIANFNNPPETTTTDNTSQYFS